MRNLSQFAARFVKVLVAAALFVVALMGSVTLLVVAAVIAISTLLYVKFSPKQQKVSAYYSRQAPLTAKYRVIDRD